MITYSKSFLEFLKNSDCRLADILYNANNTEYPSYRLMVTNEEIDYITFRSDGTISYLPAGKKHSVNDNGDWAREGRQNGKAAKVIRKLFTPNAQKLFKDTDLECFSNQYKAEFSADGFSFKLHSNKQIPAVYDSRLADGDGSLNNSCMNGDGGLLDLYKYCTKLKILALYDNEEKLCGRSLIWNLEEGITLMDRIYVNKDFVYDIFLSYAKKQNFWYKQHYKTYDNKELFVTQKGEYVSKRFTVATNTDYDSYPYIDTFSYGEDGSINNHGGHYDYNNTDGTRNPQDDDHDDDDNDHDGEIYDDINEEWINEDDAVLIQYGERRYRDRQCHIDTCVQVDHEWYHENDNTIVRVDGTWYEKDGGDVIDLGGTWYMSEDTCYSKIDGEDYLKEDCEYCECIGDYILKGDAVEVEGDYYPKNSELIVEIDGEWCLKDSGEKK